MAGRGREREVAANGSRTGEQEIPAQTADSAGPDSPLELGRTGWRDTLKRSVKEFKADRCTMMAAAWPTTGSWPCSRR
jgi:hypothetical protein